MSLKLPATLEECQQHHAATSALIATAIKYQVALEAQIDKLEKESVPETSVEETLAEMIRKKTLS